MYPETRSKLIKILQWGYEFDSTVIDGRVTYVLGDLRQMNFEVIQNMSGGDKLGKKLIKTLPYVTLYYEEVHRYMISDEGVKERGGSIYALDTNDPNDTAIAWDWFGVIATQVDMYELVNWFYNKVRKDHE